MTGNICLPVEDDLTGNICLPVEDDLRGNICLPVEDDFTGNICLPVENDLGQVTIRLKFIKSNLKNCGIIYYLIL